MEKELLNYMETILNEAIENVTLKAKSLLWNVINETIYQPKQPVRYKRTYEFRDKAWEMKIEKGLNNLVSTLFYNPNLISYNSSSFTHGGLGSDRRNILASVLDNQGLNVENSDFGGALNIQKNGSYWENFLNQLDENIWKWIDEEFKKIT